MRKQFEEYVLKKYGNGADLRTDENGEYICTRVSMMYIGWEMHEKTIASNKQADLDNNMVDSMATAMKMKMTQCRNAGKSGWETCDINRLQDLMLSAAFNNDYISTANYAGMLFMRD